MVGLGVCLTSRRRNARDLRKKKKKKCVITQLYNLGDTPKKKKKNFSILVSCLKWVQHDYHNSCIRSSVFKLSVRHFFFFRLSFSNSLPTSSSEIVVHIDISKDSSLFSYLFKPGKKKLKAVKYLN